MDVQVVFDVWNTHPDSPVEICDAKGELHRVRRADLIHVGATKLVFPLERDGWIVGDREIRFDDIVEFREVNGPTSRSWSRRDSQ